MDEQPQTVTDTTSLDDWQVQETKHGLLEAERNEFASAKEIREAFKQTTQLNLGRRP